MDDAIKVKKIKIEHVWTLEQEKIVIIVDNHGCPIGEEGRLFLGAMVHLIRTNFPIDYKS